MEKSLMEEQKIKQSLNKARLQRSEEYTPKEKNSGIKSCYNDTESRRNGLSSQENQIMINGPK